MSSEQQQLRNREPDYYTVLGLPLFSDIDVVRKQYRRLAMVFHPDKHLSDPHADQKFALINIAFECLGDSSRKAAYDQRVRVLLNARSRAQKPSNQTMDFRPITAAAHLGTVDRQLQSETLMRNRSQFRRLPGTSKPIPLPAPAGAIRARTLRQSLRSSTIVTFACLGIALLLWGRVLLDDGSSAEQPVLSAPSKEATTGPIAPISARGNPEFVQVKNGFIERYNRLEPSVDTVIGNGEHLLDSLQAIDQATGSPHGAALDDATSNRQMREFDLEEDISNLRSKLIAAKVSIDGLDEGKSIDSQAVQQDEINKALLDLELDDQMLYHDVGGEDRFAAPTASAAIDVKEPQGSTIAHRL
jgi:curved DNA-binding protein CbpA